MLKLLLLFSFLSVSFCNDGVVIKWITKEQLNDKVEIKQVFQNDIRSCEWWKLTDNKAIDHRGANFGDDFVYDTSAKHCSLIIPEFTFEKGYLDFYKPIIRGRSEADGPESTFAISYLKAFEITKKQKNKNIYEYNCQVTLTFPDSDDENLNDGIRQAVQNTLNLNGGKKIVGAPNEPKSYKVLWNKIIKIFKGKERRDTKVNDFIIGLDPIEVTINTKRNEVFECSIELIDETTKSSFYSKTLSENLSNNPRSFAESVNLRHKIFTFVSLAFTLIVLFFLR